MSDRLQQEIDEILSKYDKLPRREPLLRRLRRRASELAAAASRGLTAPLRYLTAGRLMLAGLILVLAAVFFGLGGPSISRFIIIAGLVVLFAAFIASLSRRRYPRVEQRWRGRPLDLREPSVGTRLRAWWERWQGRRRSRR